MKTQFTRLLGLLGFLLTFLYSTSSNGQTVYTRLFWPNFGPPNLLESLDLDGTNRTTIVNSVDVGEPIAVDVDGVNGKIYWFDQADLTIKRANLNGTGTEIFIADPGFASTISIDAYNGKLYWPNFGPPNFLERINLDGTGREVVVGSADVGEPIAVSVDGLHGKVYWFDQADLTIKRANLDGTGTEIFVSDPGFASTMKLDARNGKLYWPNFGPPNLLESINLDGTGRTTIVSSANVGEPIAVTVDEAGDKIYWFDQADLTIKRSNLDDTGMEIFVADPGFASTIAIAVDPSVTLPLNLLSFSGKFVSDGIDLQWKTAEEVNTKDFTVERMETGGSFKEIDKLPARGEGGSYTYRDLRISAGTRYYYRLKMADLDGQFTYSPTIQVNTGDAAFNKNYSIFPNPVVGSFLQIKPLNGDRGDINIRIIDLNGKTWYSSTLVINGDLFKMPIQQLPSGIFILQIRNKSEQTIQTERFRK